MFAYTGFKGSKNKQKKTEATKGSYKNESFFKKTTVTGRGACPTWILRTLQLLKTFQKSNKWPPVSVLKAQVYVFWNMFQWHLPSLFLFLS